MAFFRAYLVTFLKTLDTCPIFYWFKWQMTKSTSMFIKSFAKTPHTLMTLSIVGVSNKLQHYLIYNSCFLDILFSLRCSQLTLLMSEREPNSSMCYSLLEAFLFIKKYATIFAQRCFSSKLWLIYCKVASINTLY